MRKYYYYTYRYQRGIGHAVCSCDNGFFDVRERHEYLYNLIKEYCVITFWKEISREECEAMNDFLMKIKTIMDKARLVLRWLLIPLWFTIFIAYLPIWYLQMSWYYFSFQDYWDAFLILWNKTMLSMRLKTRR